MYRINKREQKIWCQLSSEFCQSVKLGESSKVVGGVGQSTAQKTVSLLVVAVTACLRYSLYNSTIEMCSTFMRRVCTIGTYDA